MHRPFNAVCSSGGIEDGTSRDLKCVRFGSSGKGKRTENQNRVRRLRRAPLLGMPWKRR
jgi:hypothetical protein